MEIQTFNSIIDFGEKTKCQKINNQLKKKKLNLS